MKTNNYKEITFQNYYLMVIKHIIIFVIKALKIKNKFSCFILSEKLLLNLLKFAIKIQELEIQLLKVLRERNCSFHIEIGPDDLEVLDRFLTTFKPRIHLIRIRLVNGFPEYKLCKLLDILKNFFRKVCFRYIVQLTSFHFLSLIR